MKQKLSNLLLGLSLIFTSVGLYSCVNAQATPTEQPQVKIEQQAASQSGKVYICTGSRAYAYHNNRNCTGLGRCRSCVKTVTLEEAKKQKRTPCGYCYK